MQVCVIYTINLNGIKYCGRLYKTIFVFEMSAILFCIWFCGIKYLVTLLWVEDVVIRISSSRIKYIVTFLLGAAYRVLTESVHAQR